MSKNLGRSIRLLAVAGVLYILHRWGTRWGSTPAEMQQAYPGDNVVPLPELKLTNAISIQAPAETIWPWLVQMGYYRGGWHTDSIWRDWDYYPDRILRFFVREEEARSGVSHREVPTGTRILPEFQSLKAGDIVLDGPPGTAFFTVVAIEPYKHLVYYSSSHLRFVFPRFIRENPRIGVGGEFTWAFYLQETGVSSTRLIMRTRGTIRPGWYKAFIKATIPITNLFLARKMLGGIKHVVEETQDNNE